MTLVIIFLLIIVLAIVGYGIATYNQMVSQRNTIQESWRQVDVELNRRYELIPNLVETVRGFAAHERNTLEDVVRLRNQAQSMSGQQLPSQQRADVEAELSQAVSRLLVTVEAYPELKSNQNFLALQKQLVDTEDRIAAGRRYYNANVKNYNTKTEQFPSSIIANMSNFEKATYFEVNDPVVRQAPSVNFGEISYREGEQRPADQPQVGTQPMQPGIGGGVVADSGFERPQVNQSEFHPEQNPGEWQNRS